MTDLSILTTPELVKTKAEKEAELRAVVGALGTVRGYIRSLGEDVEVPSYVAADLDRLTIVHDELKEEIADLDDEIQRGIW